MVFSLSWLCKGADGVVVEVRPAARMFRERRSVAGLIFRCPCQVVAGFQSRRGVYKSVERYAQPSKLHWFCTSRTNAPSHQVRGVIAEKEEGGVKLAIW